MHGVSYFKWFILISHFVTPWLITTALVYVSMLSTCDWVGKNVAAKTRGKDSSTHTFIYQCPTLSGKQMTGRGRGVTWESPTWWCVFLWERKCFPRQGKTLHTLGRMQGDRSLTFMLNNSSETINRPPPTKLQRKPKYRDSRYASVHAWVDLSPV